ncbi:hypothetical protein ABZ829_28065 [Streptomyces xanthochromogenes]|uniref:hypothetical protein n=1 Tax=Streptomyces xanthochromogenes TaxID=67384 RepID=UPI00343A7CBF
MSTPAPDIDRHLAHRCASHGDYLAGLLAASLLDTVALPDRLPTALFPDTDPTTVDQIWRLALSVGFRAGRLSVRPSFTPQRLARAHADLTAAGHTAMAALVHRTALVHQPAPTTAHPGDGDQPQGHPR